MQSVFVVVVVLSLLSGVFAENDVSEQACSKCDGGKPIITPETLERLGYVRKNEYSSTSFKITPRKPAPPFHNVFAVVDEKFTKVSLHDYRGKWLILFFYPFDFTFVCPTEIVSFSETIQEFRKLNTEVVAISTDSHHTHLAWIKTPRDEGGLGKMSIPILADISKRVSQDYGVLVTDENDDMFGAALRGLFVIDPKGIVRSIQINDDAVGRSVDETLRILKAFQFADSHPHQVCPANWKPGDETITTNHNDKVEFFQHKYGSK